VSEKNESDMVHEAIALPREIEPPRDLWGGIEARVQAKRRRHILARRSVTGASMLLAAAAVILSIRSASQPRVGGREHGPLASSAVPLAPRPTQTLEPAEVVVPEEASYRDALSALQASFAEREKSLPRPDMDRVGASIGAIDAAILVTRASLAEHPEDADLRGELDAEYEEEIDAMNDVLDWTTRS
jgi:hypothetical protein